VLDNLTPHQRYEVRVCWPATASLFCICYHPHPHPHSPPKPPPTRKML
jgi:hypothetical protein